MENVLEVAQDWVFNRKVCPVDQVRQGGGWGQKVAGEQRNGQTGDPFGSRFGSRFERTWD